ncbi:MAG: spore germination protein [Clostridia bacterium]|nr:spore germination protein [Clostridia bacterium]
MMKEDNFGTKEAVSLATLAIITKVFYTSPFVIVNSLGTAAWYGTLVSCIVSLLVFLLLYQLMKRFPGDDLQAVFMKVLGKVLGRIVTVLFSVYLLYYAGMNLREFLEIIKAYILPYTPPSYIMITFLSVVALFAFLGLEVLARFSYLGLWIVLITMGLLLTFGSTYYNANYIKPYLGYGIDKTIIYGVLRSAAYQEFILLAFIMGSLQGLKNFKRAGIGSILLSGGVISISLLLYLMMFQYTVGSENLSGLFQISRSIYLSRFFQRVEAIFLFIWVISSVVTVAIAFYISISIYCKALNIGDHRPLILPFSFLTFLVAFFPKNLTETVEFHMLFIRQYSSFVVYGIPVLVLVLSLILGRKRVESRNEKV